MISMKAIEVSVKSEESSKMLDFIWDLADDDIFIYQTKADTAVIVTYGECSIAYAKARVESIFETAYIKELR